MLHKVTKPTKATEKTVAEKIITLANHCIAKKNSFRIVLAGGETPRAVYALLQHAITDWNKWHIYFGDERCLPADDKNRNDTMAFDAWLAHIAIPHTQIHNIPAELPQKICIEQYTQTLSSVENFDLVLLGLGEDGHTASLFPGNDWGATPNSPTVLAVNNAPKKPAHRITLSARRLSAADNVWFIVNSNSKREMLQRWQAGELFPASTIKPAGGIDIFTTQ